MSLAAAGRLLGTALLSASVLGLAACGDKPQVAGTRKHDTKASDGGTSTAFTVPGWKPGDPASWEQELKARNQNQNEYTRTQ